MTHHPYGRSRAVGSTLLALLATAFTAFWCAYGLRSTGRFGDMARVPVVVLGPLLAASAIGVGLHTDSGELDRTAVRRWWPVRLRHLLGTTATAGALLAAAVPGEAGTYGAVAMARNLLAATGIAAAAVALAGARLSWLPGAAYISAVYFAAPDTHGWNTVWGWPTQPGWQSGAWAVAIGAYLGGAVLFAWRGPRHGHGRDLG